MGIEGDHSYHSHNPNFHIHHFISRFDKVVAYLLYHSGLMNKQESIYQVRADVHLTKGRIKQYLEGLICEDIARAGEVLQFTNAFCGYSAYTPGTSTPIGDCSEHEVRAERATRTEAPQRRIEHMHDASIELAA